MTANPSGHWVTQPARNRFLTIGAQRSGRRLLIGDRDTKFSAAFDGVFTSEGLRVLRTPGRAPQANAYAECWVGTVRRDCLDWILIFERRHLETVLTAYLKHYNTQPAPLSTRTPSTRRAAHSAIPKPSTPRSRVQRRDPFGGMIHEYSLPA